MTRNTGAVWPSGREAFIIVAGTMMLFLLLEGVIGLSRSAFTLLILEAAVIVPALAFLLIRGFSPVRIFRLKSVGLAPLIPALMVGLGSKAVFDEIDRLVQAVFPMDPRILDALQGMLHAHSLPELMILLVASVPVAGLTEEMLFRGLVQGAMEQKEDVTKAVVITAFMFAVMHFNPWWFLEVFILGIFMGILTWRCGSIYPAALAHGLYNGLGIVMTNTGTRHLRWYSSGGHVSSLWILAGLALIVGGFIWYFRVTGYRKTEEIT